MDHSGENIAPGNDKLAKSKNRLEVKNTLAIASLAITWCSYQSVLWNGVQTSELADVNKYIRQAQEVEQLITNKK